MDGASATSSSPPLRVPATSHSLRYCHLIILIFIQHGANCQYHDLNLLRWLPRSAPKHFSSATPLISFIQFLLFWGIVFLVTTTLIGDHFYKTFTLFAFGQHWSYNLFSSAIFKREKNSAGASTVGPDGIKLSNTLLMLNCFLLCIFCTHHHHKK